MDIHEAVTILEDFNRWRRFETPYDRDTQEYHERHPFPSQMLGEALDIITAYCRKQFVENGKVYTQTIDELSGGKL